MTPRVPHGVPSSLDVDDLKCARAFSARRSRRRLYSAVLPVALLTFSGLVGAWLYAT
ncbi:hypothetical protein [Curtobacterium sp. 9128]|uniref:hypothetical protein n=1 Tax=Curtobacterium sp. 9128 TaxID=1793722 RepID=UPI00164234DE|nr:hypothetical protein [Curtobacterium sp. 9128]